jgi:Spy/CpxP family protein refolding chaperone
MGLSLFQGLPMARADQEKPTIKAFSDEEIRGLLNGEGMGVAKAAELNHYPGPRHVLDLGDQLNLSEKQRVEIQKLFEKMHVQAVRLGKLIIDKEQALQNLFAKNQIDENKIRALIQEIARLQGELRFTHLWAHLQVKPILSPEQITKYDFLRGYGPHTWEIPPHHHQTP